MTGGRLKPPPVVEKPLKKLPPLPPNLLQRLLQPPHPHASQLLHLILWAIGFVPLSRVTGQIELHPPLGQLLQALALLAYA